MRKVASGSVCLIALALLAGCQSEKPQDKLVHAASSECISTQVSGRYAVVWTNGTVEEIEMADEQQLIDEVIRPRFENIKFVEPVYRLFSAYMDIDPVVYTEDVQNWGYEEMGVVYASNRNFRGSGVKVAVVDTGIDLSHPQLQGRIASNRAEDPRFGGQPGVDDDGNGYVDDIFGWNFVTNTANVADESGHGTHVAGIIAADPRLGEIIGVANLAQIIPVDFMDETGGTSVEAIKAVNYAISQGAQIINASWTTTECSLALKGAFEDWKNQPVLFVTAAGNKGRSLNQYPEFPPSFNMPNQLTVGSINTVGAVTPFSNYGDSVHVFAPGDYINSLEPFSMTGHFTRFRQGTSMSAAFVSGQAAIIMSLRPRLRPAEVKNLIIQTSVSDPSDPIRAVRARVDFALKKLGY